MPDVFPTPPLSLATAHLLNVAFTLGYVLPLYLTKFTRLSFSQNPVSNNGLERAKLPTERWRDDPAVIKSRLSSVLLSTGAACYTMHTIIFDAWKGSNTDLWQSTALRLGVTIHFNELLVYLITPLLFLGPLYGRYLGHELPFMKRWSFKGHVTDTFSSWIGIRNYIAGPITEELVWRSSIIAAYHLAGASNKLIIFLTPVSFGAAHIHHGWETYSKYGRNRLALQRALITITFQLTYTTLFGFHCAFLFLRSSSVFPPIAAHIFCNLMGIPQFHEEMRWYPYRKTQIKVVYATGIFAYISSMYYWSLGDGSFFWFANERKAW